MNISAIFMDVDGVLTDGKIWFMEDGKEFFKPFSAQDSVGIFLARQRGIEIIWLSCRKSPITQKRAESLGVHHVYFTPYKKDKMEAICQSLGIHLEEVCYIGDDLSDIPAMEASGYPVAVSNAVREVKDVAKYVTEKHGGDAAVREAIDHILSMSSMA